MDRIVLLSTKCLSSDIKMIAFIVLEYLTSKFSSLFWTTSQPVEAPFKNIWASAWIALKSTALLTDTVNPQT